MKINIEEFVKGDKNAFDWVYKTYAHSMFGICIRYANCRDDAQEILQEAFIKVYENRKKFDTKKDLQPWIKTIVIHAAINYLKVQKRMQLHETAHVFDQAISVSTEENTSMEFKEQLLTVLASMPNGYRTVFNLAIIDNLTHKEIAAYLKISEGTSKSQLAKAKAWAKNQLEKLNAYERRG